MEGVFEIGKGQTASQEIPSMGRRQPLALPLWPAGHQDRDPKQVWAWIGPLRCVPTALTFGGCKSNPLLISIDSIFKQFLKTHEGIPSDSVKSGHIWILSCLWTKQEEKFVLERA